MYKSEAAELTAEVSRLRGYKEKLEQAGDMRRRLQEKEEESESLMEQLAEKEAEADKQRRLCQDLKSEVQELKKAAGARAGPAAGLGRARGDGAGDGGAGVGAEEGERKYEVLVAQLQDTQFQLRSVKAELERANDALAAAGVGPGGEDLSGEGAGEVGGVEESVEGLGARGKEQELKRLNARLVVEVRELKAALAEQGGAAHAGPGASEGSEGRDRNQELQAALAELKVYKILGPRC